MSVYSKSRSKPAPEKSERKSQQNLTNELRVRHTSYFVLTPRLYLARTANMFWRIKKVLKTLKAHVT